ncbi:hypothetical protein VTO58DRAFT_101050 [Aureobasidium pullulans]
MAKDHWQNYPMFINNHDSIAFDHKAYSSRLQQLSDDVFQEHDSIVSVIDNYDDALNLDTKCLKSDDEINAGLLSDATRSRIILLSQNDSFEPLNITARWTRIILDHYHVMPEFLDVLLQFGSRGMSVFEQNSSSIAIKTSRSTSYNITYNLPYVEPNGRTTSDPVSRRHTGVFYRYDAQEHQELAIIINPMTNSKVEQRLRHTRLQRTYTLRHPLDLHCLVLSSYIPNWRPYIESLAEEVASMRQKVLAISIENDHPVLKANTLATLRALEDKIIFRTLGGLKTALKIVHALDTLNERIYVDSHVEPEAFNKMKESLNNFSETLQGHTQSVEIMEKRLTATISSWSSLLELRNQSIELKNQRTAEETNRLMLRLNLKSVDDNTTVKLITIFTLVYLPASFVASLFGMELFGVDEKNRFRVSSDLWVFFALALPLTVVTLSIWRFCLWRRQRGVNEGNKAVV